MDIFIYNIIYKSGSDSVFGENDSMTPLMYLKGVQWDVRARANRLLITIHGDKCKANWIHLYGKYTHTPNTWNPLDIDMIYEGLNAADNTSIIFPAFYRGSQYFDGILIPREYSECSISVEQIIGENRLPIFFTANISNGQIIGPTHKGIGGFTTKTDESTITARSY